MPPGGSNPGLQEDFSVEGAETVAMFVHTAVVGMNLSTISSELTSTPWELF